jgi:hypothetical protein
MKDHKRRLKKLEAAVAKKPVTAYFDPKTQRAFEGVRGQMAQLFKRMGELEDKVALIDARLAVFAAELHQENITMFSRKRR